MSNPCPECGGPVPAATTKGRARVFCCEAHKQAHANRMTARGKSLAKIALGWRIARGSGPNGKMLFAEMTAMLDAWNSEDKAAGRMRAEEYAMLTLNGFSSASYQDRRVTRIHCVENLPGCLGASKSSGGTNADIAGRMARKQGWEVHNHSNGICPSCIEHIKGEH